MGRIVQSLTESRRVEANNEDYTLQMHLLDRLPNRTTLVETCEIQYASAANTEIRLSWELDASPWTDKSKYSGRDLGDYYLIQMLNALAL